MKNLQVDSLDTQRGSRWVLYSLIFLSGAAGLIYEVVWARQLTLFIGNTAIANAAVLTAFMVGLALGSLVLGRKADLIAKPLRLYALLEILIGCYGATTPWLFDILQVTYANLAGVVGVSGAYSHLPRFLVAIVAMLIPTFMMGGTLPLLVKHFARQLAQAQTVTSRIYGINTLGATLGAFSAGFLLLPAIGITNTLLWAATVNIVVGLGVYRVLARRRMLTIDVPEKAPASMPGKEHDTIIHPSLLLIGFALSGFAALLYQVVWIHSLILVIGVSIYGFSTVLTVFLGGIGLGSLLVGRFWTYVNAQRSLQLAFYLQLGIALSAVASLSLISQLPILFVQGWSVLHENFVLFQAYMFLLTTMAILIPTIFLGALFPLITGLWSNSTGAVGRGVGEAYGANAIGTIAGSAVGGLFILDWLGLEGSLYLASMVSVLVAALFWYLSAPDRSMAYRLIQVPMTAITLTVLIIILPGWDRDIFQAQVFRYASRYISEDIRASIRESMSDAEIVYYKEGIHGTISVLARPGENGKQKMALLNNGKADASNTGDINTQILLGQIPMFLHPAPREVMVIGLGSGMTAGSVLQNSLVENLDILEISPEVVEASEYFKEDNYDVLNNPRSRLIVADARNYLLASRKKYDVIISEPSHSWVTGVSNLFTREFLQQANNRLKEDGILVQWYHLYGVDRRSLKALLRSVSDVFPNYTLWSPSAGDIIIVSSNKPLALDYQQQLSFFASATIRQDLARIDIHSPESFLNHLMMSSGELNQLLTGHEANTDENPVVEFNAPKHLYEYTVDDNVAMLYDAVEGGEYALPIVNLVKEYQDWIVVPFMGVQLNHGGNEYSTPSWNGIRKSVSFADNTGVRLLAGMSGEIILKNPWGDVVVHSTMGKRRDDDQTLLFSMLEHEVPNSEGILAGEMKAPGNIVYWRAAPSSQAGKIRLVLARKCERETKFDYWISIFTNYPGNTQSREDMGSALQTVNQLFRCIPDQKRF